MDRTGNGRTAAGCVLLARTVEGSAIWTQKPAAWLKIWLHLILRAAWADTGALPRGCGWYSWRDSRAQLHGVTRDQWNRCLAWLQQDGAIEILRRTPRMQLIRITQYDTYQSMARYQGDRTRGTPPPPETLASEDPQFAAFCEAFPRVERPHSAAEAWRAAIAAGAASTPGSWRLRCSGWPEMPSTS